MRSNFLTIITALVFTLTLSFLTAGAQTPEKLPAKEASLIAHLVKEANQPDHHSIEDFYLSITIGKFEYLAELKSGKVVSRKDTQIPAAGSAAFTPKYS